MLVYLVILWMAYAWQQGLSCMFYGKGTVPIEYLEGHTLTSVPPQEYGRFYDGEVPIEELPYVISALSNLEFHVFEDVEKVSFEIDGGINCTILCDTSEIATVELNGPLNDSILYLGEAVTFSPPFELVYHPVDADEPKVSVLIVLDSARPVLSVAGIVSEVNNILSNFTYVPMHEGFESMNVTVVGPNQSYTAFYRFRVDVKVSTLLKIWLVLSLVGLYIGMFLFFGVMGAVVTVLCGYVFLSVFLTPKLVADEEAEKLV